MINIIIYRKVFFITIHVFIAKISTDPNADCYAITAKTIKTVKTYMRISSIDIEGIMTVFIIFL